MTQQEWTARFIAKYCEGDSSAERAARAKNAAFNCYFGGLRDIEPETAATIGGVVAQQNRESDAYKAVEAAIEKAKKTPPVQPRSRE